jgi:hypothetical protein
VDPVPGSLLRISGSAGNRARAPLRLQPGTLTTGPQKLSLVFLHSIKKLTRNGNAESVRMFHVGNYKFVTVQVRISIGLVVRCIASIEEGDCIGGWLGARRHLGYSVTELPPD